MFRQNLHTHCTFDDGQNTMEQMVQSAISAGLTSLGFSIHTPMPYEDGWGWTIAPERLPDYIAEARRLKETYRDQIAVYCGMEWELVSAMPADQFDYVIGSIHHITLNGEDYSVDAAAETTAQYLERVFPVDADAAAEAYFAQYAALAQVDAVDIVGHFDLLTKFDELNDFYHADAPRFLAAAKGAMDALVLAGKIFEINTGAISRGYRTMPYPSRALLTELKRINGRITISSDSHSARTVAYGFDAAERLALDCGFTEAWVFDGKGFVPEPLGKKE